MSVSLSLSHPFGYVSFLQASIYFDNQSPMIFLNRNPCMSSWPGVFQFDIFCAFFCVNQGYFCFRAFFQTLQLFFCVVYQFCFSVMISTFQYFVPNCLASLTFDCGCLLIFSAYLLEEFSFVVLECTVLSVLFLYRYLFSLPSFASTFLSPRVVSFVLLILLCFFRPDIFSRFSFFLVFLLVEAFLFVFPV